MSSLGKGGTHGEEALFHVDFWVERELLCPQQPHKRWDASDGQNCLTRAVETTSHPRFGVFFWGEQRCCVPNSPAAERGTRMEGQL